MNKYRYIQSGRSMVEMLAVLAIIGILIIAGIVGYSYAMQLFREAETYDNISTTVAGGRTWPILDHYGKRTLKVDIDGNTSFTSYVIPIRDVVSKVKYKSAVTAEEAGIDNKSFTTERAQYDARRELEAFDGNVMAPVWVRAEDNKAWSVRIVGLSQKMCKSLVSNRTLGYHKAYIALRDKNGAPVDPFFPDEDISAIPEIHGKGFKNDPRYTNQDMKEAKNVNALCQTIDELNSPIPPVQQFLKVAKLPGMKDPTVDASASDCKNPTSIACLARGAKVNGKHLQTLVLWWGEEDDLINIPDPTGCEAGTAFKIIDGKRVLDPECCKTELNGVWARLSDGKYTCCQTGAVDLDEAKAVVNNVGRSRDTCTQSPACSINGANVTGRAIDNTGRFEETNSFICCANCYNGADRSAFCCGIKGQSAGCQAIPQNEDAGMQPLNTDNAAMDLPQATLCPADIVACCGGGETAKSCGSSIRTRACCERFQGARWQGGICCKNWGGYYKGNKKSGYCKGIPGSRR